MVLPYVVAALAPQAHQFDLMAAMISGITALLAHSMFDSAMDHGTISHGAIVSWFEENLSGPT